MPQFKITVVERATWFLEKMFEAETAEAAQRLAEEDESWTDLDGWEEVGSWAGESAIESVKEIL